MSPTDQRAYDDLRAWSGQVPGQRTFQLHDGTPAGVVVVLCEGAGSKLACGAGNDLDTASKNALAEFSQKYPTGTPKAKP